MTALPETIRVLSELMKYADKDRIIEIVTRQKNKRYKTFQKVMIDNARSDQEKALAEKVMNMLNKSNILNQKNLQLLSGVAQMQKLSLVLNGLNLCATCAGFAIMFAKLDKMKDDINQQFLQLQKLMKNQNDIQETYEFNKALSEHTNMLDCEKKQRPYSEDQLRQLVDREYNVLQLLIDSFRKDVSGDRETLIFSIFSLLAMLTVSLRKFDETYYYNNHEAVGNESPWHLAHDKWTGVYATLSQPWFLEKLEDYGVFDASMSLPQVDAYCATLMDQVADLREEVEDNQALIMAFGDMPTLRKYKQLTNQEVAREVEAAFRVAGTRMDQTVVAKAFENTMRQVAMA